MSPWLLVLIATLAHAGERPEIRAEHVRLVAEMDRLSAENRWDGVDDHYQTLTRLRGADVAYRDHWLGAQAAAARGDVQATWDRLQQAMTVEFSEEAVAWWAELTARYGEVSIKTRRSYEGSGDLRIDRPPLDPEPRATIQAAHEALEATGQYRGLLPLGQYQLGEVRFDVVGGPAVTVTLR
ncbi:MAG: hypothetical protein ACI8S6_004467 [Myxococcota bacterium]|jgi:hypothetical protein